MDFFSWLPIIIFLYAVSTIFGSNSKKSPNRRTPNRPQGSGPSRTPNPRQETKITLPNWREKFEELERELFPRDIRTSQPSRPSSTGYQNRSDEYDREDLSMKDIGEGDWGTEGRGGVEAISSEGTMGHEGTHGHEANYDFARGRRVSDKPLSKPSAASSVPVHQESPVFPGVSQNPLVQGVIWAEVLGKPRGYNKMAYKRRM